VDQVLVAQAVLAVARQPQITPVVAVVDFNKRYNQYSDG
jgi:hypothetical protein